MIEKNNSKKAFQEPSSEWKATGKSQESPILRSLLSELSGFAQDTAGCWMPSELKPNKLQGETQAFPRLSDSLALGAKATGLNFLANLLKSRENSGRDQK